MRKAPSETLYSRFYGEQPEVTNIRKFGCLAYAKINNPVTKLAERASEGVYFGRSEDKSAYIVRVKASSKMLVTPHVMFVEEFFPGIGARRGEPEVNAYIDPLSASEPETSREGRCWVCAPAQPSRAQLCPRGQCRPRGECPTCIVVTLSMANPGKGAVRQH